MALNEQLLKGSEALKTLTPDQITAIVTLSQNDEDQVIAGKYKTLFDEYDSAIQEVTGKTKPRESKTIDHLKSSLRELKEGADKATEPLQKKIKALEGERDELKLKVEQGAVDEALRKEHEKLKGELSDKTVRISKLEEQLKTDAEKAQGELEKERQGKVTLLLDTEFSKGLQGIKFKDEKLIPLSVRETFIENAKEKIRAKYKPDFVDEEGGKRRMVLRDDKGMIVSNPKNLQKPFSPGELLLTELDPILEVGKRQPGTGTGDEGGGAGGAGTVVDISGAKTRTEAVTLIRKALVQDGITVGSAEFGTKSEELYKEYKVADLPIK